MVYWCYIRPKRYECFSYHLKRLYTHISGVTPIDYASKGRRVVVSENSSLVICQRSSEKYITARFFAAPVQAKPKPKVEEPLGPRLNKAIKANKVRLVTEEGHVIVSMQEALERAMKLKLDLVEVQRTADPPVCKIMDFHKEKYKQQIKDKERVKQKSEAILRKDIKEVRFTGKTEQKDLKMKADMVKRLMERGYRVKCMAMGKEEEDLGGYLSRLSALIEDVAYVESGPRVEKRQAFVLVRHLKFGATKKNPGKKSSTTTGPIRSEPQKAVSSPPTINDPSSIQMPTEVRNEDLDIENEILFNKAEELNVDEEEDKGEEEEEEEEYEEEEEEEEEEAAVAVAAEKEKATLHSLESPLNPPTEMFEGELKEQNNWSTFDTGDTSSKVLDFDDRKDRSTIDLDKSRVPNFGIMKSTNKQVGPAASNPVFEPLQPSPQQIKSTDRTISAAETMRVPANDSSYFRNMKQPHIQHGQNDMNPKQRQPTSLNKNGASRFLLPEENDLTQFLLRKPPTDPVISSIDRNKGSDLRSMPRVKDVPASKPVFEPHRESQLLKSTERINRAPERKWVQSTDNSCVRNVNPPPPPEQARRSTDPKQGHPVSSYGIFSTPLTGHPTPSGEAICDLEQKFVKSSNLSEARRKPNTDISDLEVDKSKQGGWGIFSTETFGTNQHKNSDSQVKVQR